MLSFLLLGWVLVQASPASSESKEAGTSLPRVVLETSLGRIVLELEPQKAPKTVANFLTLVDSGHYNGTIFHRVVPGFVIQGGGFTADMVERKIDKRVENEADNGLKNTRGTVAMARTSDPHSAGAQFFINLVDNPFLDHRNKTTEGWGYCVFGRVVEGLEVVDRIAAVKRGRKGFFQDVPVEPVTIEKAYRLN
jgi:cyclophilin family peptidyl-prolyl cis-trans isomerase